MKKFTDYLREKLQNEEILVEYVKLVLPLFQYALGNLINISLPKRKVLLS